MRTWTVKRGRVDGGDRPDTECIELWCDDSLIATMNSHYPYRSLAEDEAWAQSVAAACNAAEARAMFRTATPNFHELEDKDWLHPDEPSEAGKAVLRDLGEQEPQTWEVLDKSGRVIAEVTPKVSETVMLASGEQLRRKIGNVIIVGYMTRPVNKP